LLENSRVVQLLLLDRRELLGMPVKLLRGDLAGPCLEDFLKLLELFSGLFTLGPVQLAVLSDAVDAVEVIQACILAWAN